MRSYAIEDLRGAISWAQHWRASNVENIGMRWAKLIRNSRLGICVGLQRACCYVCPSSSPPGIISVFIVFLSQEIQYERIEQLTDLEKKSLVWETSYNLNIVLQHPKRFLHSLYRFGLQGNVSDYWTFQKRTNLYSDDHLRCWTVIWENFWSGRRKLTLAYL